MPPGEPLHPTAGLSTSQCPQEPLQHPQVPCPQTPFEMASPLPLCPQRRSGRRRSQRDRGHGGDPRGCTAPRPLSTSSSRGAVPLARAGPPPARRPSPLTTGHAPSPQGAPTGTEVPGWGTGQRGPQPGTSLPSVGAAALLWHPWHGGGHGEGVCSQTCILMMGSDVHPHTPHCRCLGTHPSRLPCSRSCAEVCHPEPEAG